MNKIDKKQKDSLHLWIIFSISFILLISIINSWYYLFSLLTIIGLIFYWKINIKTIIFYLLICLIPISLNFLINDYNVFKHLHEWIDNLFHFSIRNILLKYIDDIYNEKTASFIKLFLFNFKDKNGYEIYKQMINLSIVYLIVISGFHLSLLRNIIKKILKTHTKTEYILSFSIIFFYTYLLSFSISANRVIISMLVSPLLKKHSKSRYDCISLSGFVSLIIFPQIAVNLGFCMSYFCTYGIVFVISLKIENYFIRTLIINLIATMLSLPFAIEINQNISLFAILNSLIFSSLFCFLFIILSLTFWIKWFCFIGNLIYFLLINIITCFNYLNIMIKLWKFHPIFNVFYMTFIIDFLLYSKKQFLYNKN